MGVDAVVAAVSNRDRCVEHLLDHGIEGSRAHHLFDTLPRALERARIVGECTPEVVDELGLSDSVDVIKDRASGEGSSSASSPTVAM